MRIAFISLGCDKNMIDAEVMLGLLTEAGHTVVTENEDADIIIINTCCFIEDALSESIEAVLEAAEEKTKKIILTGCMAKRYQEEIFTELPEVDYFIGVNYTDILYAVSETVKGNKGCCVKDNTCFHDEMDLKRKRSDIAPYAYLKIAEGCDNFCTYCAIPGIRGKYRSRSMKSILTEANTLAGQGVKELILVAQDTTLYGKDLEEGCLPDLLKELCKIDGIQWIRLLYCYPEHITDALIDVIATEEKICHYIDMPIQHADDGILKKMGRKNTSGEIRNLIEKLRNKIPDIALRTTIITGFPGEGEKEFEHMLQFIKEMRFDRLGVFAYSREKGTPAYHFPEQINHKTKQERKNKIMVTQKEISEQKSAQMVGRVLHVMVEGKLAQEDVYAARSYKDAPDIDGYVFVPASYEIISGTFLDICVTKADAYDLTGEVCDESSQ